MILLFAVTSVFSYGQSIIVQSTNKVHSLLLTQYKKSPEITSAIDRLKSVIYTNPDYKLMKVDVVVKVTIYNPAITILPIKSTIVYSDIDDQFYVWGDDGTGNRIVLNFLFKEIFIGNSRKLEFADFRYQESGDGEQIPELVANYIREYILKQQDNDVETIIKKGLNAVKNAFDRRFQQEMISNAPPLLPQKRYYKGYTYFRFRWFNLKVTENQDKLPYDLEQLYQKDETSNYVRLPDQSVQSLLDKQKTIFTLHNEKYVKVGETEVSAKGESIYFEGDAVIDPNDIYGPTKEAILSNVHTFKGMKYIQNPKDPDAKYRILVYSFDDTENALSQLHKIKVEKGLILEEEEVDEYTGLSVFGKKFSFNQPTWCNKFAKDVTNNTYLGSNSILEDTGAGAMNQKFKSDNTAYIDITKIDKNMIWNSYINKGYLVFFSNSGHIEVGFPDNEHYLNYRERHPDDTRYQNISSSNLSEKKQLTIGAGSTVGYKPAKKWAITEKTVKIFLYLASSVLGSTLSSSFVHSKTSSNISSNTFI